MYLSILYQKGRKRTSHADFKIETSFEVSTFLSMLVIIARHDEREDRQRIKTAKLLIDVIYII